MAERMTLSKPSFGNRSFTSWNSSNTTTARFFPESSFCGRSRTSVNASAPICSSDGSKEKPASPVWSSVIFGLRLFRNVPNFLNSNFTGASRRYTFVA